MAFTILCLAVLIADMGFCGGSNRALAPQQQTKFDAAVKAVDDRLDGVEEELKRFEEAPAQPAYTDLAAFDKKLSEAGDSVRDVHHDAERDWDAGKRASALSARYGKLDERLTAVYRKCLGADACARLDAAEKLDIGLQLYDHRLEAVEETPLGQNRVKVYFEDRGWVTMDLPTALRELGDKIAQGDKAFAAVREFIDGPSRDHVRAKQHARLEAMAAGYADLAKRLDAVRKARGIQ
jgi:hypothetical protein